MQTGDRSDTDYAEWQEDLYLRLKEADIRQAPYVPDAGHSHLIRRLQEDDAVRAFPLTTEEEGIAALCGAWLGGDRGVLLMQSSGVGNCINMLSLVSNCRFPFVTIVTMRGEAGEFNPWQVPMGRNTAAAFDLMGVSVRRVETPDDAGATLETALHDCFLGDQAVAVLLSQRLIGRKKWVR